MYGHGNADVGLGTEPLLIQRTKGNAGEREGAKRGAPCLTGRQIDFFRHHQTKPHKTERKTCPLTRLNPISKNRGRQRTCDQGLQTDDLRQSHR